MKSWNIQRAGGEGLFDDTKVLRTFKSRSRAVQICYERFLNQSPTLAGDLQVDFTLDLRGAVTEATVVSDRIGSPQMGACVVKAIRRLRFNPGPDKAEVHYRLRATFESGGERPRDQWTREGPRRGALEQVLKAGAVTKPDLRY